MGHRIAVIGCGKIARDQHLPAIAADPRFELVAVVDATPVAVGVPCFPTLAAMLAGGCAPDAVAICTPPQVRGAIARAALAAGLHVLLEKPPAQTGCEAMALAGGAGPTRYASWHSRHAPMVAPAKAWLAGRTIRGGRLVWREDAHRWHPGQHWLWAPGGLGVFDPTINAFSILTEIVDAPLSVTAADFQVPVGLHAPIAAQLELAVGAARIAADLHFNDDRTAAWTIELETDGGTLALHDGGAALELPGAPRRAAPKAEYAGVYDRFAGLIAEGRSDLDLRPLQLVADAFLIARTCAADPFEP